MIIPYDEFLKRYVADVRGSEAIIDDWEGEHLAYRDIPFDEFFAKQINNRINHRYTQSMTPPTEDAQAEILKVVSQGLQAYKYYEFSSIVLHDFHKDEVKKRQQTSDDENY